MTKIQNKCSHIIVFPPSAGLKKLVPNKRSNIKSPNPTVNGGKANNINEDVTNVVHVNIGIRIYVIPGARILIMVTRKLMPPINVPIPEICKPST